VSQLGTKWSFLLIEHSWNTISFHALTSTPISSNEALFIPYLSFHVSEISFQIESHPLTASQVTRITGRIKVCRCYPQHLSRIGLLIVEDFIQFQSSPCGMMLGKWHLDKYSQSISAFYFQCNCTNSSSSSSSSSSSFSCQCLAQWWLHSRLHFLRT